MKECALNIRRVLAHSERWSSGSSECMDIREIPNYQGCGVYEVRLTDAEGLPVEVPRSFDTDNDGINPEGEK